MLKHHFHMEENQKIYCTSFSAITLRHVGLHATRTGWKIRVSPPSWFFFPPNNEDLEKCFLNQHFRSADKAERAVLNYAGNCLVILLLWREEHVFSHLGSLEAGVPVPTESQIRLFPPYHCTADLQRVGTSSTRLSRTVEFRSIKKGAVRM